ncbi:hypothetical protein OAN67_02980 [Pelagibacteraceae bacterium]|jgi:hypothetical protein|nr:hypothetical protein [Pelagibacteraceae bacterium]|tara:strand:- start:47 stop:508 length:462 start_codon:yes stop_codon:yes gene_type:complete
MELKKYLIFIAIFSFTKFLYADIIKPAQNLTAFDVVKIQLNALKNNNIPSKNTGIKQTWNFAHPENKKFTGPYKRFEKMLLGNQYNFLLNHDSHKIKLIMSSKNTYIYNIELISKDKKMYFYKWHLEKSSTDECSSCWFTTIVSPPTDKGNTI